jgi:hypothetical protein
MLKPLIFSCNTQIIVITSLIMKKSSYATAILLHLTFAITSALANFIDENFPFKQNVFNSNFCFHSERKTIPESKNMIHHCCHECFSNQVALPPTSIENKNFSNWSSKSKRELFYFKIRDNPLYK